MAGLLTMKDRIVMVVGALTIAGMIWGGAVAYKDLEAGIGRNVDTLAVLSAQIVRVQAESIARDQKHDARRMHDGGVSETAEIKTGVAVNTQKIDQALQGILRLEALFHDQARREREMRQ